MKIGVLGLSRLSPIRGIGRTLFSYLNYWVQCGHTVIEVGTRESRMPLLRNISLGLKEGWKACNVIVVPHMLSADFLAFSRVDRPVVTMVHDLGVLDCSDDASHASMLTKPIYYLNAWAMRRSSALVCVSSFTRERLIDVLGSHGLPAIHTIHHGVNHSIFFPRSREAARQRVRNAGVYLDRNDFALIYVGAEYARKNMTTLIDGFALLRTAVPGAKLIKVGSSYSASDREVWMNRAHRRGLSLGRDVFVVEGVVDETLADLYCAANVFVTTSKYEGFCLPLLEAMACGLPAVASNTSALPEIGGNAAFYVDPNDAYSVAQALRGVAANQLPDLSARSRERAACFSWNAAGAQMTEVLRSVTNPGEHE